MFLEWFGTGRGVVGREEMMRIILGWERWSCELEKQIRNGGHWAELEDGVGGDRFWWRGVETVEGFELVKLYQL